ncbi:RNA dependent RNA polymerase-domain-containing protein [Rhodocollybia butyracea]|uniref:RNA-dependent RNA polymerase n=1 Tax=Rhodocollybia butyracea TaxID=206335 RepID=A0A9P5UEZ2_9AGAR|nr:RNA dependent RNA polymerase-domain-containing protein [Rhodocollybia butyracea]
MSPQITEPKSTSIVGVDANVASTSRLTKRSVSDASPSDQFKASLPTSLGKRSASDSFLSQSPRSSKILRQDEPAPSLYTPVMVAHSKAVQKWIDQRNLTWGVAWEIARLVSSDRLTYDAVPMSALDELKKVGNNAKGAPLVEKILLGKYNSPTAQTEKNFDDLFANEHKAKFPYEELDTEEELLSKDPYAGLGFNENSEWFGGRVVFRGRITLLKGSDPKKTQFKVVLEKPELGASCRFTRRFGSKSFMRVKVPKSLIRYSNDLMDFFRRPLVISGRVYRAFLEKDKNVFFFMTNEVLKNEIVPESVSTRLSFTDFLNWHNPVELNMHQSAAKYASRLALGLSTSAPGLMIKPENIKDIDDVVSAEGSDMTDGAGLINKTALRELNYKFNWDIWPTAIQCRIAGAKGMLLLHASDSDIEPRVYIRPSTNKIQYTSLDPAQCIIDVLRSPHPRFQSKLSAETIINLAENGVSKKVFYALLDNTLDSLVLSLTTWKTSEDMENLWDTLSRLGGVFSARFARRRSGMARVKGYSERDNEDHDEDALDEEEEEQQSTAWWGDEVSGQPSSLEETVMRFIDAGFKPDECAVMGKKLKKIIYSQIDQHAKNFRIEVPMSFTGFILPDPEGILEEGEIFFKSSQRGILTEDGQYTDVLIGPVIVTRHPCKLPTDAQKWKAVDRLELRHYTDVILISVKGARRGADWLGGGDYDGDKALVLYQPEIVSEFKNADRKLGDPREDIKASYFFTHTETVAELVDRVLVTSDNPLAQVHAFQEYLIGGIKTASGAGRASNMHDFLMYTKGYAHPETIRMAHIFCHTLDGIKTGLIAKPELWGQDTRRYDKGMMHWKETESKTKGKTSTVRTDNIFVVRPPKLHPFIMDKLQHYAEKKASEKKQKVDETYNQFSFALDKDLTNPWTDAEERAERLERETKSNGMKLDLAKIKAHVKAMRDNHRNTIGKAGFTDLPIEVRQDTLRSLSRDFANGPDRADMYLSAEELMRLKASYAYLYDCEQPSSKWTRFPWDMTMLELTAIKARATGRSRTVTGDFYEIFGLKRRR